MKLQTFDDRMDALLAKHPNYPILLRVKREVMNLSFPFWKRAWLIRDIDRECSKISEEIIAEVLTSGN